jgi:hypothetical protein
LSSSLLSGRRWNSSKGGAQFLALEELQQTLLGPVGILDALAAGVFVLLAQKEMDTSAREQGVLRLVY